MATYVRSRWSERRPHRRRLRSDRDAARWSYDELDAAGRPIRHIEMRADNGTFLAAADREVGPGVVPEAPGADPQEMTADTFEELWRLARCQLNGEAEVQIAEIRPATAEGLPVVVRCVGGRVRPGSSLHRVRETGQPVAITVTRILRYDRDVDELTPAHTATLILAITGPAAIRAGHHLHGRTA